MLMEPSFYLDLTVFLVGTFWGIELPSREACLIGGGVVCLLFETGPFALPDKFLRLAATRAPLGPRC